MEKCEMTGERPEETFGDVGIELHIDCKFVFHRCMQWLKCI
jgi:hypothetical protein